jgi:hypothetical protein
MSPFEHHCRPIPPLRRVVGIRGGHHVTLRPEEEGEPPSKGRSTAPSWPLASRQSGPTHRRGSLRAAASGGHRPGASCRGETSSCGHRLGELERSQLTSSSVCSFGGGSSAASSTECSLFGLEHRRRSLSTSWPVVAAAVPRSALGCGSLLPVGLSLNLLDASRRVPPPR